MASPVAVPRARILEPAARGVLARPHLEVSKDGERGSRLRGLRREPLRGHALAQALPGAAAGPEVLLLGSAALFRLPKAPPAPAVGWRGTPQPAERVPRPLRGPGRV